MSPNEKKALEALVEHYCSDFGFFSFAQIAVKSGLDPKVVRRTVRSLKRKGFAEFAIGLWSEDGEPRGSGYRATEIGLRALNAHPPRKSND